MHHVDAEKIAKAEVHPSDLHTTVCKQRAVEPQALRWLLVGLGAISLTALLGCQPAEFTTGSSRSALHASSLQRVALPSRDLLRTEQPQVFLQASWGSSPQALGKRDEASRPGPMSLTVADDASLFVLDQVNQRVLRFDAAGRAFGVVARVPETTEDIVVVGSKLFALVYESGASPGFRLERHELDARGAAALRQPLSRSIQLVTGLFATGSAQAPDLWVEQRHDTMTRVAAGGALLPAAEQRDGVLGRPFYGATGQHITALRVGSQGAKILQVVPGRGAQLVAEVSTVEPLLALHALESDAFGRLYLGLLLQGSSETSARRLVLVIDGSSHRLLELPQARATDAFRPLAVGRDGAVYFLTSDERGVTILHFPAPTRRAGGAA